MADIRPYLDTRPDIHPNTYLDRMATIIGDVTLSENTSVWPFAVIRGDVNCIEVGKGTNIQDHAMLHVSHKNSAKPEGSPLCIGEYCTIGHRVTLHGCTLGNHVLVGIGSVVLDDAIVDDNVIIGAGSLVPPRKKLVGGYLYMGSPVQAVRPLTEEELQFLHYSAEHYIRVMHHHQESE